MGCFGDSKAWQSGLVTDKTSLKADREDWGEGVRPTAPGGTAPRPNGTGGSSAENHKNHAKT